MRAILSDIHGNLEALTAVLSDLEQLGLSEIYNLGDTLGYGPNPIECLDLASQMAIVLMGNFDYSTLDDPVDFCTSARNSIYWTQDLIDSTPTPADHERRVRFLTNLPRSHRDGDVLYVHASARNPLNEYVFPEDIENNRKMATIGEAFGPLCFAGHTHIPGLFVEGKSGRWDFIYAEECDSGYAVTGNKIICNVGSVGQPRDEDERACYVLFDGERIRFRRVEYDIETTIRKIYAIPQLDNFLGDRLREGR